ncbi:hypothetical protein SBOR_1599 [Sclerotinia borealis F-4128]|uniref:Carrier domain-containing protein n=1 Tax=Sclerotinia borealis (strain F-4128) TaxID=1432307 RepID=W9CPS6_SCLBF|nr:hypothetical protein SBOR_1599 [Sclerotinia borealis F-4128]
MSETNIPIAVIGLACRFPGGIHDAESLWEVLIQGKSTWSDIPADRYDWRSFYHPTRGSRSAHSARGGYFLNSNIAEFDANFFGISPLEAVAIDPQQRILLEVTYEAMENAGISIDSIKGSNTGVYVATFTHDYENMMYHDSLSLPKYGMTGVGTAIASNRISYFLDLRGPSMSLDTGCSGSLVALHQACQSLRCGETNTSFVGGTNLILSPDTMIPMDNLHLLDKTGTCYPFDSRGSGYGRGEGAALVILKRLDDALSAGDSIRAIIRNTAIGQDGKTPGITFPNGDAQESLIRSVYQAVSLNPSHTGYVEAHGTGTVAGDVTEIQALGRVFRENRWSDEPLYVGSIKGNIGHLESASGLAGLIKVILMLEKGVIPATPGFEAPKDGLDLSKWNIKIPQSPHNWPNDLPRRASLNSFGYGGANAHAIIEAASLDHIGTNGTVSVKHHSDYWSKVLERISISKAFTNGTSDGTLNGPINGISYKRKTRDQLYQIFPLTAKSEEILGLVAKNLRDWTSKHQSSDRYTANLAHTLTRRGSHMPWHCTLVASGPKQLISKLEAKELKPTRISNKTKMIYIFTGQGSQWHGMARELMDSSTEFCESLKASERILKFLGCSWSLVEELGRKQSTTRIDESTVSQPLTTSIQIALVQLLRSLNVTPDRVLGHSSGELAAAYAAGYLSHELAMKLSYYRGLLGSYCKRALGMNGSMLVVGLGGDEIMAYLKRIKSGRVSIACCNSPSNTTISGDEHAIDELSRILQKFGIPSQKLRVDTAYHSHHMEVVAEDYLRSIGDSQYSNSSTSTFFHSSVTGKRKQTDFDATYWTRNLVSKVLFVQALQGLLEQVDTEIHSEATSSSCIILEVGPSNALNFPIKQGLTHKQLDTNRYTYMSTLRKDCDAQLTFLQVVSKLFDKGYPVDIASANRLNQSTHRARLSVLTDLPTYPWDHAVSYWHESQISKEHRLRTHPYHDLLGIRIPGSPNIQPRWRHVLNIESFPWLQDHVVDGRLVFPGSGYLAMAIEAKRQLLQDIEPHKSIRNYILKDVIFSTFLEIQDPAENIEVQLSLIDLITSNKSRIEEWQEFRIISIPKSGVTTENCKGMIKIEFAGTLNRSEDDTFSHDLRREQDHVNRTAEERLVAFENKSYHKLDTESFYRRLQLTGNYWGPSFAAITEFTLGDSNAIGTITIPNVEKSMPGKYMQPHIIHPTTLDALIHSSLVLFSQHYGSGIMIPIGIEEVVISADVSKSPGQQLSFMTCLTSTTSTSTSADISAFQETPLGKRVSCVQIRAAGLRRAVQSESGSIIFDPSLCYHLKWGIDLDYSQPELHEENEQYKSYEFPPETKLSMLNDQAYCYVHECLNNIHEKDVRGKYAEYYQWMLKYKSSRTISARPKISELPSSDIHNLGVEGDAVSHIGTNLMSILVGKIDPLQLLLENNLLRRIYAESTAALQCYRFLITYVKNLTFMNPNMRILEVGAGTAGATMPLFEGLDEDGKLPLRQYDFTDVSTGFLDDARPLLQKWEGQLFFKTFDCSKNPTRQGLDAGTYDLIIAYNAMHAANSIDESITNVRKLLKTGGRLILIEITRLEPFINAIFGLLPGWYMDRADGREGTPILSTEQWNSRLINGGFNGCEFIKHDIDGPSKTTSLIVSRAVSLAQEKTISRPSYLVHDNSQAVRSLLGQKIQKLSFRSSRPQSPSGDTNKESVYVIIDDALCNSILNSSSEVIGSVLNVAAKAKNILWIITPRYPPTLSSEFSGLATGFARGARVENQALNLVTLDIQGDSIDFDDLNRKIDDIFNASFLRRNSCIDTDYIYRDGKVLIPRLQPNRSSQSVALSCATTKSVLYHQSRQIIQPLRDRGPNSSAFDFTTVNLPETLLSPGDIEVKVEAWSVSTEDLLTTFGHARPKSSKSIVGGFAGTVIDIGQQVYWKVGDRVCGWSRAVFANSVRVNSGQVCQYSKSLTIGEAACMPTSFLTAFYALVEVAKIRQGQTVVIHDAGASVGQAAIQVSKHIGANVIAVITRGEHQQILIDNYKLSTDRILYPCDSRAFESAIQCLTSNGGAHLVLHSSSSDIQFISGSMASLARFGTFVQIGNIDSSSKLSIGAEIFEKNVSVVSLDLAATSELQPEKMTELMGHVNLMFEKHNPQPIRPVVTMDIGDFENAVKRIQQGGLTGQVVFKASDTATVNLVSIPPPLIFNSDGTYIVVGNSTILSMDMYKFLLMHEAKNVLVLFTGTLEERIKIERRLTPQEETKVRLVSSVDDLSAKLIDLPSIRGIIYTEFVSTIHPITADDTAAYVKRDFDYINTLMSCLKSEILDFLVIISSSLILPRARNRSIECAIPASRQALLASGLGSRTKLIHVDMANLSPISESYQSEQEELSLGRSTYSHREIFAILESEISSTKDNQGFSQILTGLRESTLNGKYKLPLYSPLLKYLPEIWRQEESLMDVAIDVSTPGTIDENLADAKTEVHAHKIVKLAVQKKIASMMAVHYDLIDMKMAIEDFGLDSLITFTFRNWIFQNFRADLNVGVIFSASSIDTLAYRILSVTTIKSFSSQNQSNGNTRGNVVEPIISFPMEYANSHTDLIPKQPLPALEDCLRHYLDVARRFCSIEELARTKQLVEELEKIGGQGQILQARLLERKNDPSIDNWLSEIYLTRRFLQQREPLVATQSYFGTHPNGLKPHTQAERATIVTLAALKFKKCYESGSLPKRELHGRSIDTHAYRYLFNVCREPHIGEDIVREYPSENYIVVLNNGHGYKINLAGNNEDISFPSLEMIFEKILHEPIEQKSWVGTLSADNRDDWAKARNALIELDERNKTSIETIEAAAFIVCLDDATPEAPSQRFSQFLFGNGSSRWYDKSLQFVVCKNGISASVCEHSVLDGITVEYLHEFINKAIIEHQSSSHIKGVIASESFATYTFELLHLSTNSALEYRTQQVHQNLQQTTSKYTFAHLDLTSLSLNFLSQKGIPTQSGIQLALQLAYLRFFAHSPPALETVSLAQFRQGRVEVHHIITPLMAQFLITNKHAVNIHSRDLLYAAAKEHAKSLTRASKGRGFSRHLLAMEWMVREGEKIPAFFHDPVYARMKPEKVLTSCFTTGWQEGGFVYPFPGSVLVYFEVRDESTSVSIFGNDADAENFKRLLVVAGDQIQSLLDGS